MMYDYICYTLSGYICTSEEAQLGLFLFKAALIYSQESFKAFHICIDSATALLFSYQFTYKFNTHQTSSVFSSALYLHAHERGLTKCLISGSRWWTVLAASWGYRFITGPHVRGKLHAKHSTLSLTSVKSQLSQTSIPSVITFLSILGGGSVSRCV